MRNVRSSAGRVRAVNRNTSSSGPVSLSLGGSAQALTYAEPLGAYPDGSARTLFIQFTRSMTNGSALSGTLTIPNRSIAVTAHRWDSGTASTLVSFGVPLQLGDIPSASRAACTLGSWIDDSATWTNNTDSTWYSAGAGVPAGVLVPTNAVHLAASCPFGPVVPQASQPSFTVGGLSSTAVDSTFATTLSSVVQAWNGSFESANYGNAIYGRVDALLIYWHRTGSVDSLRTAIAFASRRRTRWVTDGAGLGEQEVESASVMALYLYRRDTSALTWIRNWASQRGGQFTKATWQANDFSPRFFSLCIRWTVAALKCGLANEFWIYDATQTYLQFAENNLLPLTYDGDTGMSWSGDKSALKGVFTIDATTPIRPVYAYMAGIYIHAMLELFEVLPASTNRTTMRAKASSGTRWLYDNMRSTSIAGKAAMWYSSEEVYTPYVATVIGSYSSGSTTIVITPPPSGTFNLTHIRLGSETRELSTYKYSITSGSGNQTCSLLSGFTSNYSDGQSCKGMERNARSPDENVDLNQFISPIFAAEAQYSNDVNYANAARALYVVTAGTPQDNNNGPALTGQKVWDQNFFIGQHTLAYLHAAGI